MITPEDLSGVEENLARRIIMFARSVAPCLDNLAGEDKLNAIAILQGVIDGVSERGSLHILSERAGTKGVSYSTVRSWFQPDDRSSLRALCPVETAHPGPVGDFPTKRLYTKIWPEGDDCV